VKLRRVEVDHALFNAVLHKVDVLLLCQRNSRFQRIPLAPGKQAVRSGFAARCGGHRQQEYKRTFREKVLQRIVEHLAHGREIPPHHALHAVDRADHMGLVDHVRAARADENVLGVVGLQSPRAARPGRSRE
jgi:hypothetical protein